MTRGLADAAMALASPLPLDRLLQVLVDVSRELLGARYAALGVINAEGTELDDFITSGLTAEQRARIGNLPRGHGILGLLIRDARVLRLRDLREHIASVGVPPNHPPMKSFLGAPVMAKDRVFGNLYLTDKIGAEEFSAEDEIVVQVLAAQAAIAIENARLRTTRDRFFAAASHELGNAIAGVKLWARHLMNNPPASRVEWTDGLRKILSGAEQTDRMIEDLLSLSKIEEGKLSFSAWAVDISDVVTEAIDHLGAEADAADVAMQAEMPAEPIGVEVDAVRLRQILVNLLANAVKFSPAGSGIIVRAERTENGSFRIVVRDGGPGIKPQDAERIFLPFEQVAGVARGRGSGLGLPLSRKLARLMGGELAVIPGSNGGEFILTLPLRPSPEVREEGRPAAREGSGYSRPAFE